jgi:hypothetical protein
VLSGGGFSTNIKGYLHQFHATFEHAIGCGGGSGGSIAYLGWS